MKIAQQDFVTLLPSGMDEMPILSRPVTGDNAMTTSLYYDSEQTTNVKGAVLFFAGGNGRGQIDAVTSPRPTTICSKGYIYVNCLAPPNNPTEIGRQNQFPVHDFYTTAVECAAHLTTLHSAIFSFLNNTAKVPVVTTNFPIVLTGTSRGAGVVGSWSELSRGAMNTKYNPNIKGILANAPAGSLDEGKYRDGYYQIRSLYHMFQCANHPILGTVGANDITNMTRPAVERSMLMVTNPNVAFKVIGDASYPHTWTYDKPEEFMNMALKLFTTSVHDI